MVLAEQDDEWQDGRRYFRPETMALIDKGKVELEAYTAWITEERCSGCQICVPLCPFSAIEFNKEKKVSALNEALCKGCGTCVAACPSGVIKGKHFSNQQILAEIASADRIEASLGFKSGGARAA